MRFARLLFTLALVCAAGASEAMNLGVRTAMLSAAKLKTVVNPDPTKKTFDFVDGQFNVTKVYDGNAHTIDTDAISTALSTLGVQVSVSYTGEVMTNVGSRTISYKFSADGYSDYVGSSTIVITPKPITVTANNQEMYVGDEEPEFTFVPDGLIVGDTLVGTPTSTHDSQVGTYKITQGSLTDENNPNYSITFVEGTLTIKEKLPPPPPVYCPELPDLKESYGEFTLGVNIDPIDFDFAAAWKVTGLPTGLKFALDKTTKTYMITGKPTKPGAFTVTISKTANKVTTKVSTTFVVMSNEKDKQAITLAVGGMTPPDAAIDEFAALELPVGVKVDWPIEAAALSTTTLKVAGLPAGLKLVQDKVTKACSIQGVPTAASKVDNKTGKVTSSLAKFTVTTAGKNSRVFAMPITVTAMPTWAVGTFNGGYLNGANYPIGISTLTIGATGKISGKVQSDGLTWTLSAASFDFIDEIGAYHATLTAMAGKDKQELTIAVDAGGIVGSGILAFRNRWKEPELVALGKELAVLTKNGFVARDEISLKIAASGVVTATKTFDLGTDAKGKVISYKASCSTTLLPVAGDGYTHVVFIYFAPNLKNGFGGYSTCLFLDAGNKAYIDLTIDGAYPDETTSAFEPVTLSLGAAVNWKLEADALTDTTIAAAGLPSGLKLVLNKQTKAYSIEGNLKAASKVDKKTGKVMPSLVKLTVTTAGKNKRVFTMEITVTP